MKNNNFSLSRKDAPYEVLIPMDGIVLHGLLNVPPTCKAIVVFVHGSGSSRFSPRNLTIAEDLYQEGFATLLFDLLTDGETTVDAETAAYRFDIELLTERLLGTISWLKSQPTTQTLNLCLFGASTGAAAAIRAAATLKNEVVAIVSRGGRPDLAGAEALSQVVAPTLFIVGGLDEEVLALNIEAKAKLAGASKLEIIENATHLFEEPGKLEEVEKLTLSWLKANSQ
jgi:putative phosphoribosyl transferase